jgi:hypothetical protein
LGHELSSEVKDFIAEHIHSVIQLEVLLLVSQDGDKVWTAENVGREVNLSPQLAEAQLDALRSANLLDEAGAGLYRYNPSSDQLRKTVKHLAGAYATQRVAVLTRILAKPVDKVRLFTEAFRMIKGDE